MRLSKLIFILPMLIATQSHGDDRNPNLVRVQCWEAKNIEFSPLVKIEDIKGSCGSATVDVTGYTGADFPNLVLNIPTDMRIGQYYTVPLHDDWELKVTKVSNQYGQSGSFFQRAWRYVQNFWDRIVPKSYAQEEDLPYCNPDLQNHIEQLQNTNTTLNVIGGVALASSILYPPSALFWLYTESWMVGASMIWEPAAPARICPTPADINQEEITPAATAANPNAIAVPSSVVDALAENPLINEIQVGDVIISVERK